MAFVIILVSFYTPDPLAKEAFTVVLWIEASPPLLSLVGDWEKVLCS